MLKLLFHEELHKKSLMHARKRVVLDMFVYGPHHDNNDRVRKVHDGAPYPHRTRDE
jgi:hypothetical protein